LRVGLAGASVESVVVKHVQLPTYNHHPRGWNTDIGHQRKVKSYQVETTWYDTYSKNSAARLPNCLAIETQAEEVLMVLEDLDEAGFPLRKRTVVWEEIAACLAWLAQFHASYLGHVPDGLWEVGTYWHLATRPQELAVLDDQRLRAAAPAIDAKLNACTYQTFGHGDAKLANFCFAPNGQVAGVDFQYVGGGCGMKDVAYFIGSCLDERACERMEAQILDTYFGFLQNALGERNEALEQEWRSLYRVAWADFHRFLKGWSPGHWKINSYSERVTAEVIKNL
ncbi:MAG: phosphotransferase, partial [Saprospiraceae bacterium]